MGIAQAMSSSWKGRNHPSEGDFRARGGLTRARSSVYTPGKTDMAESKFWADGKRGSAGLAAGNPIWK